MGWKLLFGYMNAYSNSKINMPFSNLKCICSTMLFLWSYCSKIDNPHKKCPVTMYILMHTALKQPLSHPPLLLTSQHPFFFLLWPAPPHPAAAQSGQEGEAEPSGADNWIGVEAQLPAAAAATAACSGKLPAPPPTSLAHSPRTHTEPLIGNCCRHCFTSHAIEK